MKIVPTTFREKATNVSRDAKRCNNFQILAGDGWACAHRAKPRFGTKFQTRSVHCILYLDVVERGHVIFHRVKPSQNQIEHHDIRDEHLRELSDDCRERAADLQNIPRQ